MGKHTAYWEQYTRAQVRGTLRLFAALLAWLVVIAVLALFHGAFGSSFPWLIGTALIGLAATVALMGIKSQRVVCPECGAAYTRAKLGGQCPSCGLRLLQHDP